MMGNIGNQLFIYAFARRLQLEYGNEEIIFDLSALKRYYYTADYKLDQFNLPDNISYDVKKIGWIHRFKFTLSSKIFHVEQYLFQKLRKNSLVPAFITKKWLRRGCIYYTNRTFMDFPKINRKFKYVYGYFQGDQYFNQYIDEIRKDITLKSELTDEETSFVKMMANTNSVGISIRANKTPENPKVKDNVWLGFITKDFYYKGMEIMAKEIKDPRFFVFADDIQEVENNYKFPYPVTIVKPSSSASGVILLSSCKNFIITNSTFSWWGAYLSNNVDKKVVMPTPWDRRGAYRECIYFKNVIRLDCDFED